MKVLSENDIALRLGDLKFSHQNDYFAMYNSYLGGIVKNPSWMLVPVDDHLVHRGDGVFEAIKWIENRVYVLTEHLERLILSAEKIGIKPPTLGEMKSIALEVAKASGTSDGLLRYYLSRGPGGFTTNPYDSVGSQLYVVGTRFKPVSEEKYASGVTAAFSSIAVKESFWPQVKSCNYLPNVLMKKEAVDRGVDFTIGLDEGGGWTEGSTENIAIVDAEGFFVAPAYTRILKGITLERCFAHANALVSAGVLRGTTRRTITRKELPTLREVMMIGTTLDSISVTKIENQTIGSGKPGPVSLALRKALRQEMVSENRFTTSLV